MNHLLHSSHYKQTDIFEGVQTRKVLFRNTRSIGMQLLPGLDQHFCREGQCIVDSASSVLDQKKSCSINLHTGVHNYIYSIFLLLTDSSCLDNEGQMVNANQSCVTHTVPLGQMMSTLPAGLANNFHHPVD